MTALEQEYIEELATAVAVKVLEALNAQPDDRPPLTVKQAAVALGIGERGVRGLINAKPPKLASMKVGPSEGTRVVEQAEIDRYKASRREVG